MKTCEEYVLDRIKHLEEKEAYYKTLIESLEQKLNETESLVGEELRITTLDSVYCSWRGLPTLSLDTIKELLDLDDDSLFDKAKELDVFTFEHQQKNGFMVKSKSAYSNDKWYYIRDDGEVNRLYDDLDYGWWQATKTEDDFRPNIIEDVRGELKSQLEIMTKDVNDETE